MPGSTRGRLLRRQMNWTPGGGDPAAARTIWSRCPGLNRGPTVYETVALPLSYSGVVRGNWYPRLTNRASGAAENTQPAATHLRAGTAGPSERPGGSVHPPRGDRWPRV